MHRQAETLMPHPTPPRPLTSAQAARDRQLAKRSWKVAGAEWVTEVKTGSRRRKKEEPERDGGEDKQQEDSKKNYRKHSRRGWQMREI